MSGMAEDTNFKFGVQIDYNEYIIVKLLCVCVMSGGVQVVWLDKTSAFVALHDRAAQPDSGQCYTHHHTLAASLYSSQTMLLGFITQPNVIRDCLKLYC